MQPTMAMNVHTPSSYLAKSSSRDSSVGVFGSIAQVNMYRHMEVTEIVNISINTDVG